MASPLSPRKLSVPLTVTVLFLFFTLSLAKPHSDFSDNAAALQIEKFLDAAAATTTAKAKQTTRARDQPKEFKTQVTQPKILLPTDKIVADQASPITTTTPVELNIETSSEKKQPVPKVISEDMEDQEKKLLESGTIPIKIEEPEEPAETETEKFSAIETTQPLTVVNLIPIRTHFPHGYRTRHRSRLPYFRFPRRCHHQHHSHGLKHHQLLKQWESRFDGYKKQPQQLEEEMPVRRPSFTDDLVVYKNGGFIRREEIPARWIDAGELGGAEIFHPMESKIPETDESLAFERPANHFYHHHKHSYEHEHEHEHHHHHHHHELDDFVHRGRQHEHEHKHAHERESHDHEEAEMKHHVEKDDGMFVKIRKFLTGF